LSRIKDTDYLTISARLHALETKLLTRERMERMIEAKDHSEAAKVLAECGYGELADVTPSGVEALLNHAQSALMREFAAAISKKLEEGGAAVQLPGNRPYKEFGGVPFHPVASERCGGCGTCVAECPAGAIPVDAPHTTDAAL
jgi:ferredoxin